MPFILVLALMLSACSSLGPSSDKTTSERSPSDAANESTAGPVPTGTALVDVLASSFTLDKATAIADGVDAMTLTIALRTPSAAPASEVAITVTLDGASNVIEPALVLSDRDGNATVSLRSTRAQTEKLTIRVQQGLLGTRTVTFVAGPVDEMRSTLSVSPNHQRASGADDIVVVVHLRDASDNPVRQEPIALSISGSGNTVSVQGAPFAPGQVVGVSNDGGDFTVRLRSTTAESKRLVATAQGTLVRGMARFVDDWFLATGAPYGDRFDCVAVDGTAGDRRWYAHTSHGTFASERGEFAHLAATSVAAECRSLAVDDGALYATFADDRARTLDAGVWTQLGDVQAGMRAIFVDKRVTQAKLWLATANDIFQLNGATWQAAGVSGATGARDFVVDGTTLFVATQKGVYAREVADASWTLLPGLTEDTFALAVAVEGSVHTLYAATRAASVWRRTIGAGGSWQQLPTGLPPALPCTSLAVDSSSTPARVFVVVDDFVGLPRRLYSKLTDAATWSLVEAQPANEGEPIYRLFVADGLHAAVRKRGIVELSATLSSVTRLGAALPAYGVRAIAHDLARDRLFALGAKGLYRSDDFGEHWRALSLGDGETPVAMTVDSERSPSRLLVSSDALTTPHLFESQDGGDSFSDVTGTVQTSVALTTAAYAYSTRALFVADAGQLLTRTQAPSTYSDVPLLTPPFPMTAVNLQRLDAIGEVLYVNTDAGVFSRVLGGAQAQVGGDPLKRPVRQTAQAKDGALWFATDLGLFRLPLATADASRVDEGGATAALGFGSVATDTLRAITFALSDAAIFRIDADLVPTAQAFTPLAPPRALSVVTKLGTDAPPLVIVGCDDAAGVYASIYE